MKQKQLFMKMILTKIKKAIKPKQGRVVVFNGKYWHTAEQPKKNKRCIINYDIV